jgi:hypothetical protein
MLGVGAFCDGMAGASMERPVFLTIDIALFTHNNITNVR